MQPTDAIRDITRASASLSWSSNIGMTKYDGQPHDIHALLSAFGAVAAESNAQIAVCLQALGTAAFDNFQLHACSESAAFVHYLRSRNLVACPAWRAIPRHPTETRRLSLLAVDKFIAAIASRSGTPMNPQTAAPTSESTTAHNARHTCETASPPASTPAAEERPARAASGDNSTTTHSTSAPSPSAYEARGSNLRKEVHDAVYISLESTSGIFQVLQTDLPTNWQHDYL